MTKEKKFSPFENAKIMEHPSFVAVGFSRITGLRRFFGSSVQSQSWIRLRVSPAQLHHDSGYDRVHSSLHSMIEVDLSPAQFAELLTSLNVGCGVPGTLVEFDGKRVEQMKEVGSETQRVREHYEKVLRKRLAESKDTVEAILAEVEDKKTFTQDLKGRLRNVLESLTTGSHNSMPYYIDQFQEATERVTSQAKAEVDAFVTHAVHQTGLKALKDGAPIFLPNDKEGCTNINHPGGPNCPHKAEGDSG